MKTNMGTTDRVIRAVIAIGIGVLYFTGTVGGTVGIALLVIAVVFLGTSMMGSCPAYVPLGVSTKKEP